jgi:hypothetical protein
LTIPERRFLSVLQGKTGDLNPFTTGVTKQFSTSELAPELRYRNALTLPGVSNLKNENMKKLFLPALMVLPILLSSCATPPAPQAFHTTDHTALVIESLDGRTSRLIQPTPTASIGNEQVLSTARTLPQHETAIVILENYTEAQIGDQFRDRGTPWFIGLRCLGYEHIVFLQGRGGNDPEGLITLAKYD